MTLSNRDTLAGTSYDGCSNVVGFDPFGATLCKSLSPTNPTAGLVLKDFSANNQFFFIYITFVI